MISFTARFALQLIDVGYALWFDDGGASVAAIGFWSPFQIVFLAIWVGLSAGFTATLSTAFGNRDEHRVATLKAGIRRILVWLVPILSLSGFAMWFGTPRLGLEPEMESAFRIYATTLCFGLPLASFWSIYPDSIVKAHHDMRSTMYAGFVSAGANVVFNTLFVLGFGMGIFGLALGTIMARIASLLYATWRMQRLERQRMAALQDWSMEPTRSWTPPHRAILALSVPSGLAFSLAAAESGLINFLLKQSDDPTAAIASFTLYERVLQLALMPTIGASVAVLPYVARNVAEGRGREVAVNLRNTLLLAAGLALLVTIPAGLIFPDALARALGDDSARAPELADKTRDALRLVPLAALALVPFTILRPVFEALERPRLGILVSVLRYVVIAAPLILLGVSLAERSGADRVLGVVGGTIAATTLASLLTAALAIRLGRSSAPSA